MRFELISGLLCLDFTNTVHCYGAPDPRDDLRDLEDLVDWGVQSGAVRKRNKQEIPSARLLQCAKETREVIYRIFNRIASGKQPATADLQRFSLELAESMKHRMLGSKNGILSWVWDTKSPTASQILWKVLDSAATLLTSSDLARVRECKGPTCTWLFVDQSKNRTRKWCDMDACGNREKSRRHYAKTRNNDRRLQPALRNGGFSLRCGLKLANR